MPMEPPASALATPLPVTSTLVLAVMAPAPLRTAATLFGNELARACNGRFQLEPWLEEDDSAVPRVFGTSHHLGTTRMADDPGQGVVDRECKVHGIDNLYVAGSSVFPTGGWAFPTFTIVALSLRLAEHLRSRLELVSLVAPFVV